VHHILRGFLLGLLVHSPRHRFAIVGAQVLVGHGLAPPAVELPSMHALLMAKGQQLEAAARENGAKSCSFDGKFQSNKFNWTKPRAGRAIGKVPDSDNDRLRNSIRQQRPLLPQ
jgi:hypothetical protein